MMQRKVLVVTVINGVVPRMDKGVVDRVGKDNPGSDAQEAKGKKGEEAKKTTPTIALTDSYVEVDFKGTQQGDEENAIAFLGGNSFVEDQTVRTSTVVCDLMPEWNHKLHLPDYNHHLVKLNVYDEDPDGSPELIGHVHIPKPSHKNGGDIVQTTSEVIPEAHEYPLVISLKAATKQKEGEKPRSGMLSVAMQWQWMPLAGQ
jgi:hypothetical protein